jgi:CheY-like chemotaxis protein
LEPTTTYFIIDDDVDDQNLLVEALIHNDATCRCLTANDGQEGITYLLTAAIPIPDVIFLDLNMPVMSGRVCLTALKQTPRLQHIPVIIYSTTSNKKEILETMEQGASYFLTKKNSFKELYEALALIPVIADREPHAC